MVDDDLPTETRDRVGETLRYYCPECGKPVEADYQIRTGDYGDCPWDECDAVLVHEVEHTVVAVESKEQAEGFFDER
jgi:DNA-directed RNA polymerase subunit RPC12/RpoP